MHPDRFPATQNDRSIDAFKNVLSIEFFNGVVAFHVDPRNVVESRSVRNREPRGASDFRYDGSKSAVVDWPNVLESDKRLIDSAATPPAQSLASRLMRKFLKQRD